MNAVQWGKTPAPFKKNNFGFNIGGPIAVPGLTSEKLKSFFYFDHERYRQKGGSSSNLLSIPSMQERAGDFRDWRDGNGNLIPIYDPATLRSDGHGGYIKDQFMGCDGNTPNVICQSRISPLVKAWLASRSTLPPSTWTQPPARPPPARCAPGGAVPSRAASSCELMASALLYQKLLSSSGVITDSNTG